MNWSTSTRRSRLPQDWPAIRSAVLHRDHYTCQATHHDPTCTRVATDVDHITAGDNHALTNLQALSGPCHQAKTAQEAATRNTTRATMRRRTEPHPGATA